MKVLYVTMSDDNGTKTTKLCFSSLSNWKVDVTSLTQIGFTPEVNLQRGISVYAQWYRAEVMGW